MKTHRHTALLALLCAMPALSQAPTHIPTDEWARITAEALENTRREAPEYYREMMEEVEQSRLRSRGVIGDKRTFTATNIKTNQAYKTTGTLRAIGPKVHIWVEDSQWGPDKITQTDVDSMLSSLVKKTGPYSYDPSKGIMTLNNEAFGDPPNAAGDGIVHYMVLDVKDNWSPSNPYNFIGGYFAATDQTGGNKCDILFVDAMPTIYSSGNPTHEVDRAASVIAHELQHLINYRYNRGLQSLWLNEAMSQAAMVHTGYPLNSSIITYLNAPNISLPAWRPTMDPGVVNDYAKVQIWATFLRDQFGVDVWRKIVQNPATGTKNVDAALTDIGSTFDKSYTDWLLALAVNDRAINPKYGFNFHYLENTKANVASTHWTYPVNLKDKSVAAHGLQIHRFTGGKNLSLTFTGKNCFARLMKVGADAIEVADLTSGTAFNDPQFGVSYGEALLVVGSVTPGKDKKTYSVSASADTKGIYELAHDKGVPEPFISKPAPKSYASAGPNKEGSGWAVQFDCPPDANHLTKVTLPLFGTNAGTNESSTVLLHIYADDNGKPGADLVEPKPVVIKQFWKDIDIVKVFGQSITVPTRFYIGFTHASAASAPYFLTHQSAVNRTWKITPGATPEPMASQKDEKGNPFGKASFIVHATVTSIAP